MRKCCDWQSKTQKPINRYIKRYNKPETTKLRTGFGVWDSLQRAQRTSYLSISQHATVV